MNFNFIEYFKSFAPRVGSGHGHDWSHSFKMVIGYKIVTVVMTSQKFTHKRSIFLIQNLAFDSNLTQKSELCHLNCVLHK